MRNEDYNILVTGASRGIGYAIAQALSHRCSNLLVTSSKETTISKGIEALSKGYKGNIFGFYCDQKNAEEAAHQLGLWAKSKIDHLDAIVLSAGMFIEGEICDMEFQSFTQNMNTNFTFNYLAVNALLDLLKNSSKSPRIILIGSTAAYGPYSVPAYGISKWALRGYSVNLREELRKNKIGVTFISPGPTLTDMWEGEEVPPHRILEPDDIAKVVNNLFDLSEQAVVEEIIIRPILGDIDE